MPSRTLSANMAKTKSNIIREHRGQDLPESFVGVKLDAPNPFY